MLTYRLYTLSKPVIPIVSPPLGSDVTSKLATLFVTAKFVPEKKVIFLC